MTQIEHQFIHVRDVRLHVVTAGQGDPVVLLHGWPQTWYEWRNILPALAEKYTVIAPDLRGLGDSSQTEAGYDKKNLALDIQALILHFGYKQIRLVGHDWGGIVAYHYSALFAGEVKQLAIIDVTLPTAFGHFPLLTKPFNPAWHFAFHLVPDLPEQLLAGKEDLYLRWWFKNAVAEDGIGEYVRAYSQPGALAASLAYYRTIFADIENVRALTEQKLTIPILAIGGSRSFGALVEQSLQTAATNVRGVIVPDCGHWISEEKPHELTSLLLEFLRTVS
jgi:pimeloyl-ACP methyl ester carboxylesterase